MFMMWRKMEHLHKLSSCSECKLKFCSYGALKLLWILVFSCSSLFIHPVCCPFTRTTWFDLVWSSSGSVPSFYVITVRIIFPPLDVKKWYNYLIKHFKLLKMVKKLEMSKDLQKCLMFFAQLGKSQCVF